MEFASSPRATLGVEWELALLDRESGELAGRATELLEAIGDKRIIGEFMTNTVELVSTPHKRVDEVIAELREMRDLVAGATSQLGIDPIGVGTHPFSRWEDQQIGDHPRYERVVEQCGTWGRQLAIWGVHVHVGVPDTKYVPAVTQAFLVDMPLMLALSTSSPYWEGVDTGYQSHRTMLFRQMPTSGLPPKFDTWEELVAIDQGFIRSGIASDFREVRWDVRPSSRYGTVELRTADSMPTLAEVAAHTALAQCVAEEAMRRVDAGSEPRALPEWALSANKFRACRYGFDTEFVTNADGESQDATSLLERRIEALAPIAAELGCEPELRSARHFAGNTSSDRQRRAFAEGGFDAVVRLLAEEFHA